MPPSPAYPIYKVESSVRHERLNRIPWITIITGLPVLSSVVVF